MLCLVELRPVVLEKSYVIVPMWLFFPFDKVHDPLFQQIWVDLMCSYKYGVNWLGDSDENNMWKDMDVHVDG